MPLRQPCNLDSQLVLVFGVAELDVGPWSLQTMTSSPIIGETTPPPHHVDEDEVKGNIIAVVNNP